MYTLTYEYARIYYYYAEIFSEYRRPLYEGHIGTRVRFRGGKCISTIGKSTFSALQSVLCREVISMVFFIGSVL